MMYSHYRRYQTCCICYNYYYATGIYSINQVEEQLLDNFNYVAGIVPLLKHYIKSVSC